MLMSIYVVNKLLCGLVVLLVLKDLSFTLDVITVKDWATICQTFLHLFCLQQCLLSVNETTKQGIYFSLFI